MFVLFYLFLSFFSIKSETTVILHSSPSITLLYSFPIEGTIEITLNSETQGYISIGFGSQMSNTNMIVAYMSNSNMIVEDYIGSGHSVPIKKSAQLTTLVSGTRSQTNTIVKFRRKLQSTDFNITPDFATNIIYAYGSSDSFVEHIKYGSLKITFSQQQIICDTSCQTCKGITATDCLTCNSGFSLQNGACVKSILCDISCLTCKGTGSNDCLTCSSGFSLQNGLCLANPVTITIKTNPKINLIYRLINTNTIEITMSFAIQGYISIGFGGKMVGSEIVWCYFKNGKPVLEDVKFTSEDDWYTKSKQESILVSGVRDSSKTECTFQRKLQSTDFSIVLNSNTRMIWAYGKSDDLVKHKGDGSFSATFKGISIVCDSSCLTCSGTTSSDCLSCTSDLILTNGKCTNSQDNIEFLKEFTSKSKITNFLSLYWMYNADISVTMAMRWSTGGYMSIGFGDSMKNSDMIIAEKTNNAIKLKDTWSTSYNAPDEDTSLDGTDDLVSIGYLTNDGYGSSIIKFNRKLNTGDKNDFVISQKETIMTYAYSSGNTMEYHGNSYGVFNLNFIEGNNQDALIIDLEEPLYVEAHSIGLLITWSFLIELPIIAVRYFRNWKYYLDFHAYCFLIFDVWTLIIVFIVLGKNADSLDIVLKQDKIILAHFITGIIVINFIIFQHIIGIILKMIMTSDKQINLSNKLIQLKLVHKYLGYFIYLISKACVLLGTLINQEDSVFIGFLIYYIVLLFFKIFFEFCFQFANIKKLKINKIDSKVPSSSKYEVFDNLIKDIESFELTRIQLLKKYPNIKWCLFDTKIINLNNFNHPGGKFIIEEIIGREIGRFVYGGYPLENTTMKYYHHSENALNLLAGRLISNIDLKKTNIFTNEGEEITIQWRLTNKIKMTSNVSKFEFSSKNKIKNYIEGVNWFGRHFCVSLTSLPERNTRQYTTVLSYTQSNINFRTNIIKYYENQLNKSYFILDLPEQYSNSLPFIIKRYNFSGAFSAILHDSNEINFNIKGPFGMGLELNKLSSGTHVIFSGGTGILPFIDLLDYLLKKTIYQVIKEKFGRENAMKMNPYNEDYENTFGKNFKVQLFCSFYDEEEFNSFGFLRNLYDINKKNGLNLFDMIVKYKVDNKIFDESIVITNEHFNEILIRKNLNHSEISKVYVCGNPTMNKNIPELLMKCNIEKDKIILV